MKMSWNLGLTNREAERRLKKYGKNEIKRTEKINPIKLFLSQFTSPLVLILIIAAVISLTIGFIPGEESDIIDVVLILSIVIASGIAGFFQDYKAEKSIEMLQKMSTPKAKVIREGKEIEIDATEIVPGDLILIEPGDIVPADAKLIDCFNLKVDESILTGESRAVEKKPSDEIFMNTSVYVGNAKAIVTRTGMQTKIGNIASKLQEIGEEKTPFQSDISRLSKKIFWIITGIVIVMFFVSLLKYDLYQSLLTSISLAVAAIPEGLPAVITLALAIGATTMAKKNALIRKLAVTESVGAVDIICTDKTGTLTKNEMTVTKLFFNNKVFEAAEINNKKIKNMKQLFICSALCNDTRIGYDVEGNKKYIGNQTEIALRKISERFGFIKENLEREHKKIDEIPFTSQRKMMSVICKHKDSYILYSKGAPEVIIEKCDRIYQNGKIMKLSGETKRRLLEQNKLFASSALRVLGFAFKEMKNKESNPEKNLIWLGLQAMIDPPREEVKIALKNCKTAGIRVIMLTGDNPLTAKAIADEIGLESKGVIEGKDLDNLSNKELENQLNSGVNIFARISPFHKLRILEILKKDNRVAMTGDGVNDALALKRADVGIAMGIKGTEVAKEASDMVLLDDNFATITAAIKEGRRLFDNIRKFVNYLFVCNFAEVAVLFLSTLFLTLQEPILLPMQILWINLLTDGLPALALGIDPARPDVMLRPPRKKEEPIINKCQLWLIGTIGIKKMIVLFATFFIVLPLGIEKARTALFTGFILYEFVRIGSIRYQDKLKWFSNKWLVSALIGSVLLQLLIIYTPLSKMFHIVPLGIYEWLILFGGVCIGYVSAIIITKVIMKFVKD
jgi:Ca2+-transporting ATPase